MPIIEARDLAKTYPAQPGRRVLLGRGGIASWFGPKVPPRQALAPLDLTIEPGESLGIIGRNGSGKSTLLKLIAGVTAPTSGGLEVRGRVASLLELGAGFHPMLTGRENVYLNAGLLGMRHAQTDACFDDIVDFSEIGEFIDRTVDTYSSGMYVRLAFSVAIHTNPDLFLVDEVLSVGDESFQRKCRARILELKAAGKTILFVSHDLGIVNALCDRVLLLDNGHVISRGSAQQTIDYYLRQIGRESGVHRMVSGDTEALFNHGRLSLYHRQREITAPAGIKVQFFSMGHYHESTAAEWTLAKTSETELEAEGTLPRLPVTINLRVRVMAGRVEIEAAWENHRPVDLDYAALQCFFPTSYTRWQFGDDTGVFPPINVTDRQWSNIVSATHGPGDCFISENEGEHAAVLRIEDEGNNVPLQLDNTDYMAQARLAHITEAIPSSACPLSPGRRQCATVAIDLALDGAAAVAARMAARKARTVVFEDGTARVDRGVIAIDAGGAALSSGLHLHAQFKIGGMWIMSHGLKWNVPRNENGCVRTTGRSTRVPFTLDWAAAPAGHGFSLDIAIEINEALRLEEFNVSLALSETYTHWELPEELGRFEAQEGGANWRHLNARFAPGDWALASSSSAPAITLHANSAPGTVHPTALLADGTVNTPVLQLLCSPGRSGAFQFAPGRHALFSGRVSITADQGA